MSRFLVDYLKSLEEYVPGEQINKKVIKLNTNESPFPPSPKIIDTLKNFNYQTLRLYPSPTLEELKKVISINYNVNENMIYIGNGSDEVLAFIFMAYFQNHKVLFPNITYGFYKVYANLYKANYKEIPLNNLEINFNDYNQEGHIIFPNPNAPTGVSISKKSIEELIKNNPNKLIVIDEAYQDFDTESVVALTMKYSNLIVVKTTSKSRGLAGLRLGYAIANNELIKDLEKVKFSFHPYNINQLAIPITITSFLDKDYFKDTTNKIVEIREWFKKELNKRDFELTDSKANFVFVKSKKLNAEDIYLKLKDRNILVRYFNKKEINNYLRITIGSKSDMEILLKNLDEIGA